MSSKNPLTGALVQINNLTDILNVGRLIFYSTAGFLAIYPLYTILCLPTVLAAEEELTFVTSFAKLFQYIFQSWESLGAVFLSSVIVGFLITTAGFTAIVYPMYKKIYRKLERENTIRARTRTKFRITIIT